MHGLSDIFQIMHPSVFGLSAKSWRDAGYDGRGSFKNFVRAQARVDLKKGDSARRRLRAFTDAGRPVDEESAEMLRRALCEFADGQDPSSERLRLVRRDQRRVVLATPRHQMLCHTARRHRPGAGEGSR
jgi:hypothetical protein